MLILGLHMVVLRGPFIGILIMSVIVEVPCITQGGTPASCTKYVHEAI